MIYYYSYYKPNKYLQTEPEDPFNKVIAVIIAAFVTALLATLIF